MARNVLDKEIELDFQQLPVEKTKKTVSNSWYKWLFLTISVLVIGYVLVQVFPWLAGLIVVLVLFDKCFPDKKKVEKEDRFKQFQEFLKSKQN